MQLIYRAVGSDGCFENEAPPRQNLKRLALDRPDNSQFAQGRRDLELAALPDAEGVQVA